MDKIDQPSPPVKQNPYDAPSRFTGIWMPRSICEVPDLTWTEKILLSFISSFSDHNEDCFASDYFLGQLMHTTAKSAGNILTHLRKLGYIGTRTNGRQRILFRLHLYMESDSTYRWSHTPLIDGVRSNTHFPSQTQVNEVDATEKNDEKSSLKQRVKKSLKQIPPQAPQRGADDSAISLVNSYREKFPHYDPKPNPKKTQRELKAATILLASATANEILDLAQAALSDKWNGNKRAASSLEQLYRNFDQLRAQFPGKAVVKIDRCWERDETPEEQWFAWDQYVRMMAEQGKTPNPANLPKVPRSGTSKMPQDGPELRPTPLTGYDPQSPQARQSGANGMG